MRSDLTVVGCIYLAGMACYHKQMRDDTVLWTKLSEQEQSDWMDDNADEIIDYLDNLFDGINKNNV